MSAMPHSLITFVSTAAWPMAAVGVLATLQRTGCASTWTMATDAAVCPVGAYVAVVSAFATVDTVTLSNAKAFSGTLMPRHSERAGLGRNSRSATSNRALRMRLASGLYPTLRAPDRQRSGRDRVGR